MFHEGVRGGLCCCWVQPNREILMSFLCIRVYGSVINVTRQMKNEFAKPEYCIQYTVFDTKLKQAFYMETR